MASLTRPSLLPQCISCSRRISEYGLKAWLPFQQQQTRGKKTDTNKADFITVRLLKNVATFGKKGSIVPVKRSIMRNTWYHRRWADYIPWAELRTLTTLKTPMERDWDYGRAADLPLDSISASVVKAAETAASTTQPVTLSTLSPQRTFELLSIFVPASLVLRRTPISKDTSEPTPNNNHVDLSSPGPKKPYLGEIYGSVSPADLASEIVRSLALNDEASMVQVSEADIRFVNIVGAAAEEVAANNRIKYLGDFDFEVQVRGLESEAHKGLLRRKVRVVV
ncbi:hypothetical protein EJ05DRAFT_473789 [Pseudovirgaria hyperparasitica]|uniref:Ribosomal protein L9 domain-containing protein n=1 Tax=Pseudovirgaria hyperparasitica TaxID=470096 RepID=A0A6A6WEV8_9PEZI|nr:uncharacterized protein EJ05DRAFT_473789 [Pseudovirgaria hyperparasitica]KAF2761253.1 hypothetical protein EJ05DRAFT_473789 [Pseudovirgaria hyperparasitica]